MRAEIEILDLDRIVMSLDVIPVMVSFDAGTKSVSTNLST